MLDIEKSNILAEVADFPKLHLYSEYKTTFKYSSYLHIVKNRMYRKCITKIRLSCHNLSNELYRRNHDIQTLAHCPCCNEKEVEDEFHFIIVCNAFKVIREKLLPKFSTRHDLKTILITEDIVLLNNYVEQS